MSFNHFNCLAGLYNRTSNFIPSETLLKTLGLSTNCLLLDAGGGTGRVSISLRKIVREVIVVDISRGMLRYAVRKGLSATCAFVELLPFRSNSFDRIIMVDALHHIIRQNDAVVELWRVLIPGGRIVIIEPNIQKLAVKLIAAGEKMLFMRSHFLDRENIAGLFASKFENIYSMSDKLSVGISGEKVRKL